MRHGVLMYISTIIFPKGRYGIRKKKGKEKKERKE